ncbi:hypothetical protein [Luteimonas salinilitoris]|uniref:Uncharacterized protein n=1 Tax=Luteimonas salinilitoris TaxID=3237697 RepID=A0ABV4HM83_9GAMM
MLQLSRDPGAHRHMFTAGDALACRHVISRRSVDTGQFVVQHGHASPMNRKELDSRLDSLARHLPALQDAHPRDTDFWSAFGNEADGVNDPTLSAEDLAYAQMQIVLMLSSARDG